MTLTVAPETVAFMNETMAKNANRYRSYGQLLDALVKYVKAWEPFIERWGRRGVREIEAALGSGGGGESKKQEGGGE